MQCHVTINERTNSCVSSVYIAFFFAVGSDVSVLRASMAAAGQSIYELTEPSKPMIKSYVKRIELCCTSDAWRAVKKLELPTDSPQATK